MLNKKLNATLRSAKDLSASLSLVALALTLSGCSLAPDFLRPAAPVTAEWNANATGSRSIDNTPWQEFFPDPRLQELIKSALEYNSDMRIAVARVEEARALYGIQRAKQLPAVNVTGGRTASLTPAGLSSTGKEYNSSRYDAGLSVLSFELDFWARVADLSASAKASYLATEEARRAFRLSLIADVANAYFTVLEMEDRAAFTQATVQSRQEGRDILFKRREVGMAGDLEFLQSDGALEFARADLASLERQRATAVNALVLLVGRPTLEKSLPPGRRLTEQGVVADLQVDLPASVIVKRPDVLSAEQKLRAANANIGAARAAFLPKVLITAGVGTASPTLAGLFDAGTRAWNFQPSLSMPLFDPSVGANLDLTEARKIIAIAEYEKSIQVAFREIADLLVAREQLLIQLKALEAAEQAQNQRLLLANARFASGISGYLEVLDAQRDAYAAQQLTIQTRRSLLSTAANLYKAIGGGEAEQSSAGPKS